MITYKKYSKDNLAEGARLAISHSLYIPGWLLAGNFERAQTAKPGTNTFNLMKIMLAFNDDTPIAVALVTPWLQVMVFCKKAYRRQSIGSSLITYLDVDKNVVTAGEGLYGTQQFWYENGIKHVSLRA